VENWSDKNVNNNTFYEIKIMNKILLNATRLVIGRMVLLYLKNMSEVFGNSTYSTTWITSLTALAFISNNECVFLGTLYSFFFFFRNS